MERNIIANKGNLINRVLLATQKSKFAKVWILKTCPIIILSSVITAWKVSIFGVSFCIQSECLKILTRKTLTTDTFYAATVSRKPLFLTFSCIIVKNSQKTFCCSFYYPWSHQKTICTKRILFSSFHSVFLWLSLREIGPYYWIWSVFSCIRTEYGDLLIQSEYRRIRTRKNSVFGYFSHSLWWN